MSAKWCVPPIPGCPLCTPGHSKKVEADLLDAMKQASPQFFEKLVVELLVKMGYGGTPEDAGRAERWPPGS